MSSSFRVLLFLILYAVIAVFSYWGAWMLRFGYNLDLSGIPEHFQSLWWQQGLYLLPLKLGCLMFFGQFNGFIRFFRFPDALRLVAASGLFSFCALVVWHFTSWRYVPPALVLAADFLLFTVMAMGLRVGFRLLDQWHQEQIGAGRKPTRVGIIGVGESGSSLAAELLAQPSLGMRPVAFFDVAMENSGRSLHGIPVLGGPESIPAYFESHDLQKVVLAMPKASPVEIRKITVLLRAAKIPLETVPTIGQLLSGAHLNQTREIRIEDLLYREPVAINMEQVGRLICGRRVLVTGAGGSIGSELCLQIAKLGPSELVLLDRCEGTLFYTEKQLLDAGVPTPLSVHVVDLRDGFRLDQVLNATQPELIFHAAAHKHVGMMERQPGEAFANNTIVTLDLAKRAVALGVSAFCMISTDKAVEPSNVMGVTKRLAEKAIQAVVDSQSAGKTKFAIVRFGNVIGSSGSVIPIFEKQIEEHRPVTVTHPEMTRYFMTIPEAVGLVLQATAFDMEASLYTLDMGKPVRIDDMARDLIRLKGLEPDVDIPIVYTGVRPGEKIHERIHYPIEKLEATTHPKISRVALLASDPITARSYLARMMEALALAGQIGDAEFREQLFSLLETDSSRD